MKVLIIFAICALLVVNGSDLHNIIKEHEDDGTLELVSLTLNAKKICSGIQINDLKILSAGGACLDSLELGRPKLTVSFKNNNQSYTIKNLDKEGDLAILTLDESQNPPKSKSKIKWAESNTYEKVEKNTVKAIHTDKMNKPKKVVVKILDNEQCKKLLHRQENEICSLTDNKKSHLSNTDVGSPLLFNDVIGAILLVAGKNSQVPSLYEKTYLHKTFIEKHLKNESKNKEENNPPTYTNPRKRVWEPDYPERQPQVINDLPDFDIYPRFPDTGKKPREILP